MAQHLTPEYALLVDAVLARPASGTAVRGWDPARWQRALRAAEWHRMGPALAHHCRTLDGVPASVQGALQERYLDNAARNLFVSASLQRVLEALAGAATPAMTLKGAALVETAYPDPALREMLDIDILVPATRLDDANAALAAIGFGPVVAVDAGAAAIDHRRDHHHDPALVDEARIVAVELHHHIAMASERAGFVIDGLWERSRPGRHGALHRLPSPEDLLLHVCLHFTRSRLGGSADRRGTGGALSQLCDIARIVEHEEIDWHALAAHARGYRLATRIFLALFAAREVGIPIPPTALEDLRPPAFDARLGRCLVQMRVLRGSDVLPARSLRFVVAPGREVLRRGWDADPRTRRSLARAYVRRAVAHAPLAAAALRRPWATAQDFRLNRRVGALEHAE